MGVESMLAVLDKKQTQKQEELEALQREEDRTKENYEKATNDLSATASKIFEVQMEMDAVDRSLKQLDLEITQINAEIEGLNEKEREEGNVEDTVAKMEDEEMTIAELQEKIAGTEQEELDRAEELHADRQFAERELGVANQAMEELQSN